MSWLNLKKCTDLIDLKVVPEWYFAISDYMENAIPYIQTFKHLYLAFDGKHINVHLSREMCI